MTQEINDENFEEEVLKSDKTVMIDFWAEWCGPCKMISPIIDQLSEEMPDDIKIVKINIEDSPNISSKLAIRSIPTLMIFKDGKQLDVKTGGHHTKNDLKDWINSKS